MTEFETETEAEFGYEDENRVADALERIANSLETLAGCVESYRDRFGHRNSQFNISGSVCSFRE